MLCEATRSLRAIQTLVKEELALSLQVEVVPVRVAVSAGHPIDIAKLEIFENYRQAGFMGGELTYATDLVKDPATAHLYMLNLMKASSPANFSGLECRWQDIPNRYGETVSLLVPATQNENYRDVIEQIQLIYGAGDRQNPSTRETHRLLRAKVSIWQTGL